MEPQLCRSLNIMSLELLSSYLDVPFREIEDLYVELLDDNVFLDELNERITWCRQYFQKGVFRHEKVDTVDWFAIQRIMLYIIVRYYRPVCCLETGVFYGGTTCFILNALRRNNYGKLISIDLPRIDNDNIHPKHHKVSDSEYIPAPLDVGFLVHPAQKERWRLIRGNSLDEIPKLEEQIDLYNHDSDHSFNFVKMEIELVLPKLNPGAIIMADDLDWSNGFYSVCADRKLYPLIITDNGKSGLKARTGIIKLDHMNCSQKEITG
jgi:hypothetical protein